MQKRGMAVWEVLIWAIILMVVALILIYVFKGSLDKERTVIEGQIGGANDHDKDFVPNSFDKCCNTPAGLSVGSDGCARTASADNKKVLDTGETESACPVK